MLVESSPRKHYVVSLVLADGNSQKKEDNQMSDDTKTKAKAAPTTTISMSKEEMELAIRAEADCLKSLSVSMLKTAETLIRTVNQSNDVNFSALEDVKKLLDELKEFNPKASAEKINKALKLRTRSKINDY